MNKDKATIALVAREWLGNLNDHDWENAWVALRVQNPHNYHEGQNPYVAGQLDVSDGTHTASFYVDVDTKEKAVKAIETLIVLSKNIAIFIDELQKVSQTLKDTDDDE